MTETTKAANITIKNVMFIYTTVNTPTLLKDAKDKGIQFDSDKPHLNTEYVVKALIPSKTVKSLSKKFKGCTNLPHAKEYDKEEVITAFFDGDSTLFDAWGTDSEDFKLVKFSQKAAIKKTGKPTRKPTVIGIKGRVQDNAGNEVNNEIMVGNGSLGHIQCRPADFGENGIYLYPNAVCLTDLVVYEAEAEEEDFSEFGLEELDDVSTDDIAGEEEEDFDDVF